MIPYGRQAIDEDDIRAVADVLRSDFLTQGGVVPQFEQELCTYTGARHAVAVNSATSALVLACRALGLGQDDIAWTSPITFVASANAILLCGAKVDFVDVDPETANICVEELAAKLEKAEEQDTLPKVLMVVHFAGQSCDMSAVEKLSRRYGFKIIEDASHAVGGTYHNRPVGSCVHSSVTVFSFHPVKNMTTGEGGCAFTNDSEIARTMFELRSHGVTRAEDRMTHASEGAWYYQQLDLGYNFRLTDFQAALGICQLEKLDGFVERRRMLAKQYDHLLEPLPVSPLKQQRDTLSGWHLYVIRLNLTNLQRSRREIFDFMRDNGVAVNVHYIPVHLQPYFKSLGFEAGDLPNAEHYYDEAITLPLYPGLSDDDQQRVIEVLKRALAQE